MKGIELEVADSFDRIFPPLLVDADWRDVLARADDARKGSLPFSGFRGRRLAALVLAVLVVSVATAFAFAAVRDFVFGASHAAPAPGRSPALPAPAYAADDGLHGTVYIRLRGYGTGPQFNATGQGRFTISGAITDRGRFLDVYHGVHPPGEPYTRTLSGAKGSITIAGNDMGPWRIIRGTRSYFGLRGHGRVVGEFRWARIRITMIGTVSQ